jgi:hypothetical protein
MILIASFFFFVTAPWIGFWAMYFCANIIRFSTTPSRRLDLPKPFRMDSGRVADKSLLEEEAQAETSYAFS